MINLSRFSKMTFTELVSLPNYYIHEIYKLFVNDAIEREERQIKEAEEAKRQERQQAAQVNKGFAGNMLKENKDVSNLRAILAGEGLEGSDLEELLEEVE